MNSQPLVSILMNCYNSDEFLKEAIDSVTNQTYQNWELIFIDNQSTDKSYEIVKSYQDNRIKYHKTPQFMTLYQARTYGQQFISGKYLGFLDCDDVWYLEKLKFQVRTMETKNILFVHGSYKVKYEGMNAIKGRLLSLYQIVKQLVFRSRTSDIESQLKYYDINLQTVLLRADKIQDVRFRPEYNLFGDLVFFIEYAKKNNIFYTCTKKILAITRIHPKQLSKQSSENWAKEAINCEKNVFLNKLSKNEIKAFKVLKFFYKSENFLFKKEMKNALRIKKKIKFCHPSYFINYWKTRILNF